MVQVRKKPTGKPNILAFLHTEKAFIYGRTNLNQISRPFSKEECRVPIHEIDQSANAYLKLDPAIRFLHHAVHAANPPRNFQRIQNLTDRFAPFPQNGRTKRIVSPHDRFLASSTTDTNSVCARGRESSRERSEHLETRSRATRTTANSATGLLLVVANQITPKDNVPSQSVDSIGSATQGLPRVKPSNSSLSPCPGVSVPNGSSSTRQIASIGEISDDPIPRTSLFLIAASSLSFARRIPHAS